MIATRPYTKELAIRYIKKNGTINTLCLQSLNISFDSFLKFAQLKETTQQVILRKLLSLHGEVIK